ncbi:uncharacterized protein LOC126839743 [Adelges cooleyi]|uniref:uncharacterized protein LOC126839743 n=1 Tax=Adelges cooleyi TaxID=133065 RepID=UPI00217FB3A1|nr:uncharacterized protein LOC126839743 [Adelges cooleyi]
MNWKIMLIFVIACYIESSNSREMKWRKESQLEELYDKEFLKSLTFVSTLDNFKIELEDNDIKLLSSECENISNFNNKKKSIEKYQKIMKAVLFVNQEYIGIIMKQLIKVINSKDKSSLEMLVKHYFFYVTRIFSMLHVAQWGPPKWLVTFFLFLNDLVTKDLQSFEFDEELIKRFEDLDFNRLEKITDVTCNDNDVLLKIEVLYNNDKLQQAYEHAGYMAPQNLMLFHLYESYYSFTHNSELKIVLDWESVNSAFSQITYFNKYNLLNDPYNGDLVHFYGTYHTLLLQCIQVRILFYMWFHVKLIVNMLSTCSKCDLFLSKLFPSKLEILQYWPNLADPLKHIMRIFSIKDDVYWFTLRSMIDNTRQIKKKEILELEIMLKNEFLSMVKKLELGEEKYITEQLETLSTIRDPAKVSAEKNLNDTFEKITANSKDLKTYTSQLQKLLTPVDTSCVSWFFDKTRSIDFPKQDEKN